MSFGSSGFGGFGSNNTQPSTGFGGFGASNNTTNNTTSASAGFGTSNPSGFGQNTNTGSGVFGSANNASGGFGSSPGGFGSNTGSGFGSKPAFGATPTTTGAGVFGSAAPNNAATTGFGGFGSTNNNNASSPFGGGNTSSGGIFGGGSNANKTGFGAPTNTGSSLFGTGNASSATGFGSGGFGAVNNPGLGVGVGDQPGTATTPFQASIEKEPNSTNQSNSFQNILFQDPYKKWSAEELRLGDYVQGRRHGNASGAGAFGVSSGFGGGFGSNTQTSSAFGGAANISTSGGLFPSNPSNTAATGFGQAGTSAFGGGNTSSSLFGGGNKPSGGLFANTSNQQSGSLFGSGAGTGFGTANNTAGAFGGTSNAPGGSSLFGSNNQANKPQGSGFSFGNTNSNNAASGFGAATGAGFGGTNANATSGLFASASNNNQSGGSLFGNPQQQQQNTGAGFGTGFGTQNQNQQSGSLFGGTQQKPASGTLFGSNTTNTLSGGLFSNANNQQQNTSGFGANNNAATTSSLFGAPKLATSSALFGAPNTAQSNTTGSTGIFGGLGSNNQNQQAGGSSLFGAPGNNQQKPGSLFGGTNQASGTNLFGAQNNQNQGNSLFGNSANQQQTQNSGFGGSLMGNLQQANNAPQGLTANLNDISAYGSPSLFTGVGINEVSNPGPLATPLNGNSKPRRSSILPMFKLAPAAASRFATPQKRGFGFSYSSYGTPVGSPASSISSTPSAVGRSLLGSGSNGPLSKSMSTNNLRRSFNTEDSILAPGAFSSSTNARWYGSTGSKKLVINRDIRSDLFSTPQKDKPAVDDSTGARKLSKRVSFDISNADAENGTPLRNVLPAPEDTPNSRTDETTPRQNRSSIGTNGSKTPEMEQVKGNELAIVHEEENSATPEAQNMVGFDNAPGKYWMQPCKAELLDMNRVQRQRIDGFTVGRDNVGYITFKIPVDISGIEIEDICGGIIQLEPRSATVYPVQAKKPPVGKGLNVPARISLEQSWPRGGRDKRITNDPKRFKKHVERLKRIPDTEFEDYNKDTGVWTFSVEHFTTYGLDDSDDESDEGEPSTVTESASAPVRPRPVSMDILEDTPMEDNPFDFRKPKCIPGAFDQLVDVCDDDIAGMQSFLGVSSADPTSNNVRLSLDENNSDMDDGYDLSEDEDMTRSSVGRHRAAEHDDTSSENDQDTKRGTPGGILRARMRAMRDSIGPVQVDVADGDDWMGMLRKTVSPVKRDRRLLREMNDSPSKQIDLLASLDEADHDNRKSSIWGKSMTRNDETNGFAASTKMAMDNGRGFVTSIELMNSLFEKPKPTRQSLRASLPAKGFPEWPYERPDKALIIDEAEQAFHNASRPSWGPDDTLVVTRSLGATLLNRLLPNKSEILTFQRTGIQTARQDLRLAKFSTESSNRFLHAQDQLTEIRRVDGVPMATLRAASLKDVFHHHDLNGPANVHEKRVWALASILFDRLSGPDSTEPEHVVRKAKLSRFWTDLVEQASTTNIGLAGTSEEKAVACLAGHRITEACKYLLEGKNYRLGTLVPLIGTSDTAKSDMKGQLRAWHDSKMLPEFTESIRTVYELLSGNVCVCEGMKGVPVEDRMDSFVISRKFGLDWRQSFGLRLWYAIAHEDSAAAAVKKFKEDIDQDREYLPWPWYMEQGIKSLWNDMDLGRRQDLLWGLLQLYADDDADLEAIIRPENSQLSPVDMRLCWQLGLALTSTGKVSFGQGGAEKADASTLSYAAQLTGAGEWLDAVFVLLHLCDPVARNKAIQEHLCRHAGLIGPESGTTFSMLTEKFLIPSTWLWEALALYMRSVRKDASAEVECLLRAGSFVEAHRVLVQQVAPRAVIERDYATLSALMSQFEGRQDSVAEWALGGQTYNNFLALMLHRGKGESVPPALLDKLLAGLNAMHDGVGGNDIMRYAAVSDMADETAREILKLARMKQDMELRARILSLPLTQDRLLAYSVDLGMDRYRMIMSH